MMVREALKCRCFFIVNILIILTSTIAQSQDTIKSFRNNNRYSELVFGVGLVSVHDNAPYSNYGIEKLGYSFGIGIVQSLGRSLSIRSKALYERKGFHLSHFHQYDTLGNVGKIENIVNMDFLTLSILPQYKFGKSNLFIGVGPYLGYLIKAVDRKYYHYYNQGLTTPVTHAYYNYDLGLSINIGYTINLTKSININFQVVENYGLKNISRFPSPFSKVKTNSLLFLISLSHH